MLSFLNLHFSFFILQSLHFTDYNLFIKMLVMLLLLLYFSYYRHPFKNSAKSSKACAVCAIAIVKLGLIADANKKLRAGCADGGTCQGNGAAGV